MSAKHSVFVGSLVLALAFGFVGTPVQAAPFTIDDFSTPFSAANPITVGGTSTSSESGGGILGTRHETVTGLNVTNPPSVSAQINLVPANQMAFANGSSNRGQLDLLYDSFGTKNMVGQFVVIPVVKYNSGSPDLNFDILVTLASAGGSVSSLLTLSADVNSPTSFSLPVAGFTPVAGVFDPTNVTSIKFTLRGQTSNSLDADITLGGTPVRTQDNPVPEPASLALWGVFGLAGAWYARRRFTAKAAA